MREHKASRRQSTSFIYSAGKVLPKVLSAPSEGSSPLVSPGEKGHECFNSTRGEKEGGLSTTCRVKHVVAGASGQRKAVAGSPKARVPGRDERAQPITGPSPVPPGHGSKLLEELPLTFRKEKKKKDNRLGGEGGFVGLEECMRVKGGREPPNRVCCCCLGRVQLFAKAALGGGERRFWEGGCSQRPEKKDTERKPRVCWVGPEVVGGEKLAKRRKNRRVGATPRGGNNQKRPRNGGEGTTRRTEKTGRLGNPENLDQKLERVKKALTAHQQRAPGEKEKKGVEDNQSATP